MARRRSAAAAPISNRNALQLLRSWGFQEVGGNGGHTVLAFQGRNVQLTAVGRNTPTPWKALRKAAAIIGVPVQDLMRGPTKEKVMSASEAKIAEPLGVVETGNVAVLDPPVEAKPAAPIQSAVFKCPADGCGREFDNLKSVRVHQRSHNMVKCRNCNKTMSEPARAPHEKWCVIRKPDGKLALKLASEATPVEAEPKVTKRPRGRPKGTTKAAMAERKRQRERAVAKDRNEATAPVRAALVIEGMHLDDDTLDTLIGLLFPKGIPGNLAAVTALNEWVQATEHLLGATGPSS